MKQRSIMEPQMTEAKRKPNTFTGRKSTRDASANTFEENAPFLHSDRKLFPPLSSARDAPALFYFRSALGGVWCGAVLIDCSRTSDVCRCEGGEQEAGKETGQAKKRKMCHRAPPSGG